MSLDALRTEINQIDAEIVSLLDRRARTGRAIGRAKAELGLPLFQPGREGEVLDRIAGLSAGDFPVSDLLAVYRRVMQATLAVQRLDADTEANADTPGACAGHAPGHTAGQKRDVPATVLSNRSAGPGLYCMRLAASGLHFSPGQFFQLRIPGGDGPGGDGLFLRRPFAPSAVDERGLTFYYAAVGRGTERLTRLPPGAQAALLAPLGRGYTLLPAGGRAVILGGGAGAPSLAPLARALRAAGAEVTVILGARTAALLAAEAFAGFEDALVTATDDGTAGVRGTVIHAYRAGLAARSAPDRLYCCGPMPMLRAAAGLATEIGADCEVSLEERMACGFGACVGCAVAVLDAGVEGGTRYERVCHDGPVFDARRLAWGGRP